VNLRLIAAFKAAGASTHIRPTRDDMASDRSSTYRTAWRFALAVAVGLLASACERSVLDPKGPIAAQERTILLDSLTVMLIIVVPTILAALAFAWWFRASNTKARFRPDFVYSGRIELLVWSIPILTIAFLGGLIWIGSYQLDPHRPIASDQPPLQIQVVSLDWKWLFIYPDQGVASLQQLVIPVGRPVRFSITSASVMNDFFVPQLGSQIYAMNGMVTELNLQADRAGDYQGLSAHFSGDGFPYMRFVARAVSAADFERWITAAKAQGPSLDAGAYAGLQRQTFGAAPLTYSQVQSGLFADIAARRIAPSAGPQTGRGGAGVSPRPGA
jgi:cytochrome o ubiquinol oxidase subunit 2